LLGSTQPETIDCIQNVYLVEVHTVVHFSLILSGGKFWIARLNMNSNFSNVGRLEEHPDDGKWRNSNTMKVITSKQIDL